jgi:hypothetical protein
MPLGSFTFDPQSQQVAMDAIAVRTYLFNSGGGGGQGAGGDSNFTLLPNVRCEQIQYKEGAEPPSARFSYVLDELAAAQNGWPDQFEELWPLNPAPPPNTSPGGSSGHYAVKTDDELAVLAMMPDGTTRVLFHGYARVPQTDVSPDHQSVTFVAVGVAIKCWNTPIGGRWERNGDKTDSTDIDDQVFTDLPTRFNPAGTGTRVLGGYLPNCTPDNKDVKIQLGQDNESFPLFLDPNIDRDPDPRTLWNLSKAVRYILAVWNGLALGGKPGPISNPDFTMLDSLLQNRRPKKGQTWFDPRDPSTYDTDPNVIRDYDATNKPWPEVVEQLLAFYGFGMRWVCGDDDKGEPDDHIEVYRKDAAAPNAPKQIYLPPSGTAFTDALTNLAALHAAFDYHGLANDIVIETALERFEVSVILAPGFKPAAGDEANAGTNFRLTALEQSSANADKRKMYRYYIADECADGHWSIDNNNWVTDKPIDLKAVFDDPNNKDPDKPPSYVHRYRPGKNKLFSKDLLNLPRKAQLAISRNYGPQGGADPPVLWDTVSGTDWQTIDGGWSLLNDRLGINVTAESPEEWIVGKPPQGGGPWPCPDGKLRGVKGIANANTDPAALTTPGQIGEAPFWLRLTTVIDGDFGIDSEATRRDASPMKDTIIHRVDAKDHFHYDVIDGTSAFSQTPLSPDKVQDDTENSLAHACQLRSAHEFPPLTAAVTIPWLSFGYQVGDRIDRVAGRDVSLRVNAGAEQKEAPSYPFIVALTWDFMGEKQATILQLTDRRTEPSLQTGHARE